MTNHALGLALAVFSAPLFAANANQTLVDVTKPQTMAFQPGGTIHVEHSYGQLWVEGWDKPEVEVTVIQTPDMLFSAKEQSEAAKHVGDVKVAVDRKSDSDLQVSTTVSNFSRFWHPFGPAGHVNMSYRIRVPRNSKLVIHHENGGVMVSQVVGDIEATGHRGDVVLMLSEKEKWAIDAKSKFGTVSCDFEGNYQHGWFAHSYTLKADAPAHRIFVREDGGGIEIKGSPAEAQTPAGTN